VTCPGRQLIVCDDSSAARAGRGCPVRSQVDVAPAAVPRLLNTPVNVSPGSSEPKTSKAVPVSMPLGAFRRAGRTLCVFPCSSGGSIIGAVNFRAVAAVSERRMAGRRLRPMPPPRRPAARSVARRLLEWPAGATSMLRAPRPCRVARGRAASAPPTLLIRRCRHWWRHLHINIGRRSSQVERDGFLQAVSNEPQIHIEIGSGGGNRTRHGRRMRPLLYR
jgi:hypothetical protein